MSAPASNTRPRPQLRIVASSLAPRAPRERYPLIEDWRLVADAVVACTHDLGRLISGQRWGGVHEALRERRELLDMMARMRLDADGRRCLVSLEEAVDESERAVTAMLGGTLSG